MWLIILLLTGLFPQAGKAAHIVGGEITYECLGQVDADRMRYRFTMKVYRDCFGGGAQFDRPGGQVRAILTIYRGTNRTPFRSVDAGAPVVTDILPELGINNPCIIIPTNVCVEEGVYTFEEVLPISTESYYIVYQRCCRNGTINNLRDPGGAGSSYTVEITPLAQNSCNNSPVFKQFPPIVICANEELVFDHSATDVEGDQLVYSFCAPLAGGSRNNVAPNPDAPPPWDQVRYSPTFTSANPMRGDPPLSITSNSGIIRGVPVNQGQYVVGICVQEFRNGQLLSELRRDFQFNVTFCEPQVNASISGELDGGGVYFYETCNDPIITMINRSTNVNFIEDYLWTFDIADASGNPLTFNTRNIVVEFPGPGRYTGQMVLNPGSSAACSDTADVVVVINPPIEPDFTFEYDTCVAGDVAFVDQSTPPPSGIANWDWNFGDFRSSTEKTPSHRYQSPGLRDVELKVTDNAGCTDSITKQVSWFPAPAFIILEPSEEIGCPPLEVTFTNLSEPIDDTYDIRWDFGDGGTSTDFSPVHTYTEPGRKTVTVEITSPIGCYNVGVFEDLVEVDSPPVAAFDYTPKVDITNFNPTVQFIDESKNLVQWDWDFGGFAASGLTDPEFTFLDTGQHVVTLIGTHYYGCIDTFSQVIDVEPRIRYFLPNAFTPNEDAKNELFQPKGFFRGIRGYQMVVYNRWGEVIFETSNPEEGWNGRKFNNGRAVPSGAYVYQVRFLEPRGMPREFQGTVIVIR
ncbi:MAG: PKD domain-containing protein [Bacteroidota bacterium]